MVGRVRQGHHLIVLIGRVAARFELGRPLRQPERVPGGRSNELWRLETNRGAFAVKRMIVNADAPSFVDNVETAFAIERRAWAAGVAMPEPLADPVTGRALARIDEALFRVHRWVEGESGGGSAAEAAGLLATVHAAADARWAPTPEAGWAGDRWGAALVQLAHRVRAGPERVLVVDSHRDLDRKNALWSADGLLMAVDWDAAGSIAAVHEAVSVALDWSDAEPVRFAEAIRAYTRASGIVIPAEPWIFAGWVAAQGGWLDYNAAQRADTALGAAEVTATLARLHSLAANMDALLTVLA